MGYWLSDAWYGIWLGLDNIIYIFINFSYQLFEVVSKVEIFSNTELAAITRNVYTVLGIGMLFVFAYNIILAIINPDMVNSKDDKSLRGMVKNLVVSVVLLITFPLICRYLQVFQNHVVEENTLGNLIMGSTVANDDTKKSALEVPITIFTAFYHPITANGDAVTLFECQHQGQTSYVNDSGKTISITNIGTAELCDRYVELANAAGSGNAWDLKNFMQDKELKHGIADDKMEYLYLVSAIAGGLAAYMFLSFSLDLGVRAAKLAVLKLVAPVPIMVKVFPAKKSMFDKWMSEFTKTYLEVFERIIVIYFAVKVISLVRKIDWTAGGGGWFINAIASVVIILGILKFAKDAPKLLEELFGAKIPELSIKKKLNDNEYAKRAVSLGGAMTGNMLHSVGKNFGNIVKGVKKDPDTGKRNWKKVAGGTAGLFFGTPLSTANAARRGWQNGNVENWRQVGGAVNESRAQNEADMNKLKNDSTNVFHDAIHPVYTAKNAWEGIKGFVRGDELATTAKLTATQGAKQQLDTLMNTWKSKKIDAEKDKAYGEFISGKRPKDANGHAFGSLKELNNYYDGLQLGELYKNFQKDVNQPVVKAQGKKMIEAVQKALTSLNQEEINRIFKDETFKNIESLKKVFEKDNLDGGDLERLQKFSSAFNAQVKAQEVLAKTEKKDKK